MAIRKTNLLSRPKFSCILNAYSCAEEEGWRSLTFVSKTLCGLYAQFVVPNIHGNTLGSVITAVIVNVSFI